MTEANDADSSGLVHALVLDGHGGARPLGREMLDGLVLAEGESLWVHWDRGHPLAQAWLREKSGLTPFVCDLLLEENTRPRVLTQPDDQLLLFLRGVNLNPGAVPEDMVSLRVVADARRVVSLRLRPLRATEEMIEQLAQGRGPRTASEVLLYLAHSMTDKLEGVIAQLSEQADEQEEQLDADERYIPDRSQIQLIRRRAASLRRFLAPQRDLFAQLARNRMPWYVPDDPDYWNELNNRLIRYLEDLELIRERIGLLLDAVQRSLSERANRTMYLLAIITGFFLPMSFLTGLLGINVGGIPGSNNPNGFVIACLAIAAIGLLQWRMFRRLRWL